MLKEEERHSDIYIDVCFKEEDYEHVIKVLKDVYIKMLLGIKEVAVTGDYSYLQRVVTDLKSRKMTCGALSKIAFKLFYSDSECILNIGRECITSKPYAVLMVDEIENLINRFQEEKVVYSFQHDAYYVINDCSGLHKKEL